LIVVYAAATMQLCVGGGGVSLSLSLGDGGGISGSVLWGTWDKL